MEVKFEKISDLKKYNKTYNEMIKFLKKTIPTEKQPEIMAKFEEKAFEDDDRIWGLNYLFNIHNFAAAVTSLSAIIGVRGMVRATAMIAPQTLAYYLWYKHVMKEAKNNKEEYLRFIKTLSESQNNVYYPFSIGGKENLDKMQEYLDFVDKYRKENCDDFSM